MPQGISTDRCIFSLKIQRMRFGFVFFLILKWCALVAQTPAYLHYGVQDGLPGNLVYCGLQDQRGLLWFGTDKGLASFDGMSFRVYGVADGLPDPEVLHLQEDSKGRIWVSCFQQSPCYLLDGRLITDQEDTLLSQMQFITGTYSLSEEKGEGIWFSEASNKTYFVQNNKIKSIDFPDWVVGLNKVGDTYLIMGRNSIMRFKKDRTIETLLNFKHYSEHPSISVSGNRILYAFQSGTMLFEWKNNQIQRLTYLDTLGGQAYTDGFGKFWICSPANGAVQFDHDKSGLTNPNIYLSDKKVNQVFEDKQGNLWFCTINDGVYMLPKDAPTIFRHEKGLPSINIHTLHRDDFGNLLVGDDVGNINILNGEKMRTAQVSAKDGYNLIRKIIPDLHKGYWIASDEGLFKYMDNFSKLEKYHDSSLKDILLTPDDIWFASSNALTRIKLASQELTEVITQRFTTIGADSTGNIWAGGIGGLFSQIDSFQYNWGDRFPELKNRIIDIQANSAHKLWIATPKDGLLTVSIKNGKVTGVDIVNRHLSSPITNIQNIFLESDGKVWMATNKGVFGLDPTNWYLTHFNAFDGLADDDVNAVLVYQDTLWTGSVSGLTRILLKRKEEQGNFKSLVTRLYYEKDSKPFTCQLLDSMPGRRQISLPAGINNLQLELSALDFSSRRNFDFEIIQHELLLPFQWWTFDNLLQWVSSGFKGHQDTIWRGDNVYNLGAFLPPGKYKIQVTAIKASGARSLQADTWTILKPPFWYQLIWLQLLIWGVVAYIFWRIYRARRAFQEIQATASSLQLQALQSQMNPHFIGNAINAIQQFLHPPDPEKTSEYISIFMRLLRRTMHFSEQTLVSFEEELRYNKEYLQLNQLRFEDRFKYDIIGADRIPPETPVPSMLIQPVLENATLHGIAPTGDAILRLEFKIVRDQFYCILTDNGIGFKATQRQKKLDGVKRVSKGLSMLNQKIKTLNRLYHLDLKMDVKDLNDQKTSHSGTRVTFCYSLSKIWKVKNELPPSISTDE